MAFNPLPAGIRASINLPTSTTAGRIARYTGTAGEQGQTSALTEDGSGNVGVGTAAPNGKFEVVGDQWINASDPRMTFYNSGGGTDEKRTRIIHTASNKWFCIQTENDAGSSQANALIFSRSGTTVGFIGVGGQLIPISDNAYSFGSGSNRPTQLFAVTATIGTSDAREKAWRGALTAAEMRVARRIAPGIGVYRRLDAVEIKGDRARLHVGVTAQDVIAAFADEGLDAFAYAIVCEDPIVENVTRTRKVLAPKTEIVDVPEERIEMRDGQPVLVAGVSQRQRQVGAVMPVLDESGAPVIRDGEAVSVFVPEMVEIDEEYVEAVDTGRTRYGLRDAELHYFLFAALLG